MFIEILHNNSSLSTLQEFADENGVVLDADFTINNLLNYEENATRIQQAYFSNPSESASIGRLEAPVMIRVPAERLRKEYLASTGNIVYPNTNFRAFFADKIKAILQHPGYKPLNLQTTGKKDVTLRKIHNNATVWIWCRALGDDSETGKLINVTPFLDVVSVNNAQNGGNFTLKLAPVKSKLELGGEWKIDETTLSQFLFQGNQSYVSRVPYFKQVGDDLRWQEYFFHNVISTNDVVFIQFEILDMEKNRTAASETNNLFVSTASLPGRNFDMIGLVDCNPINYNPESSDVSITVAGRDLMKVLLEDGCYFFPLDFASENGGFVNTGSNNPSFKRLVNGELSFFNAYVDRSVEFSLKFIFNVLSSIQICDSELFRFYPEKVYRYDSPDTTSSQESAGVTKFDSNSLSKTELGGIWNTIRLVVDPEVAQRRIVDSSISTDSGSLLNFVKKVCQDPFVEFYGETFGDLYYFIARKPPFTGKAIQSYIQDGLVIDIADDVISSANLNFDDSEVYSWFRLIPRGNFFGDSNGISLLQFPAIFFEEYAEIWGSRPLQVVSNYINYNLLSSATKKVDLGFLTQQATQDLAYLVETHAYLPFTRKGTITLLGDRRIKKGMFIRLKPTAEIFYVDTVSQNWLFNNGSNDRTTTLSVSRGMVEKFMDINSDVNYFNIIDLQKNSNGESQNNNFKVNKETFNFFNKRRQFRLELDATGLIA